MLTSQNMCLIACHRVNTVNDVHSASTSTSISAAAEYKKQEKYKDLSPSCFFQPVVVETLGVLGPETLKFLREIGNRIATISRDTRATIFLRQRLAVAVQIGNAACVRESCGDVNVVVKSKEDI